MLRHALHVEGVPHARWRHARMPARTAGSFTLQGSLLPNNRSHHLLQGGVLILQGIVSALEQRLHIGCSMVSCKLLLMSLSLLNSCRGHKHCSQESCWPGVAA